MCHEPSLLVNRCKTAQSTWRLRAGKPLASLVRRQCDRRPSQGPPPHRQASSAPPGDSAARSACHSSKGHSHVDDPRCNHREDVRAAGAGRCGRGQGHHPDVRGRTYRESCACSTLPSSSSCTATVAGATGSCRPGGATPTAGSATRGTRCHPGCGTWSGSPATGCAEHITVVELRTGTVAGSPRITTCQLRAAPRTATGKPRARPRPPA